MRVPGPLEKQAQSAKKYMELRDALRLHEISLWLDTLDGMQDAKKNSDAARIEAEQKLETVREQQKQQYARSEQLSEQMRQSDIRTEQLQVQLAREEEQAGELSRQMAVLAESRRNAAENIGLAKGQLEAQQEQSSALLVQLQARQQRLTDLQQQIHSKNAAYTQKQTEIQQLTQRMDGGQQETQKLRLRADEVGEQLFAVQADVRAVQAQLESLHQRERHVGDDVRSAQQRTGQEQQAQQSMQDELEHLRRSIKQAELEHKTRHDAAQEASLALHAARNAHQKLKSELTDSENRVRMLTELQRDYEGFSRAVKLVMNQASSGALKGVRGPLSSLIHVSDRYVTAVETALGAAAANIIVECAEDGKKAIQMLKRRDGGRATFLPMDTIRPQSLRETGLEHQAGFCGVAADLVECEADYRDIVDNALGRTVVAEDMDCALAIARQYRNRFRIVTRDGQLINAGGSMTGGSAGRSSGILSRAQSAGAMAGESPCAAQKAAGNLRAGQRFGRPRARRGTGDRTNRGSAAGIAAEACGTLRTDQTASAAVGQRAADRTAVPRRAGDCRKAKAAIAGSIGSAAIADRAIGTAARTSTRRFGQGCRTSAGDRTADGRADARRLAAVYAAGAGTDRM